MLIYKCFLLLRNNLLSFIYLIYLNIFKKKAVKICNHSYARKNKNYVKKNDYHTLTSQSKFEKV